MTRGTFANIRLKNLLAPGTEGGVTKYLPTGEIMPIYDASMKYQADKIPLIVLAGKDYGMGSSRDWAAKGTLPARRQSRHRRKLRAHPPQQSGRHGRAPAGLQKRRNRATRSDLTGEETFEIVIDDSLKPKQDVTVKATGKNGVKTFTCTCRIDTPVEIEYYRNGGILQTVLRKMIG